MTGSAPTHRPMPRDVRKRAEDVGTLPHPSTPASNGLSSRTSRTVLPAQAKYPRVHGARNLANFAAAKRSYRSCGMRFPASCGRMLMSCLPCKEGIGGSTIERIPRGLRALPIRGHALLNAEPEPQTWASASPCAPCKSGMSFGSAQSPLQRPRDQFSHAYCKSRSSPAWPRCRQHCSSVSRRSRFDQREQFLARPLCDPQLATVTAARTVYSQSLLPSVQLHWAW
jgi:hypothetical protein